MDVIDEYGVILKKYIEQWAFYDKYKTKMSKRKRDRIESDLYEFYDIESKRLSRKFALEAAAKSYELDCLEDFLLPGRCGFFFCRRNEAAQMIYDEVSQKVEEEFKNRTEALKAIKEGFNRRAKSKTNQQNNKEAPMDEQKSPQEPAEPANKQELQPKPKESEKPENRHDNKSGETTTKAGKADIPLSAEKTAVMQPKKEQSESQTG